MSQKICRVWSLHPKAHKPVVPSFVEEEVVASIAQAFPDVIYFFGEEPKSTLKNPRWVSQQKHP